jgi:branched-chain amino acid transport system ATP-binding protein
MVNGTEAVALPPHRIAHLGIGYCPEERGIFASLSCEENLLLPPPVASGGMSLDEIYEMFPNLKERRNSPGGRCRAASSRCCRWRASCAPAPRLLLLDEISEGLAPVIVQALGRAIRTLRAKGLTIVMVEQNFRFAAPLADRLLRHRARARHRDLRAAELEESRKGMLHEVLGV